MLLVLSVVALFSLAAGTQCPPPGSVRYMIPHETDCSKFYICAHGVPLLQSCPEGTHFNAVFMVCQNPVFAGCSNELPESDLECAWPDMVLFRPHPDTCSKFYVCEYGTPLVFDCPAGTEFNAELKECVWPHESNCDISGSATDAPSDGGSQNGGCVQGALSANEDCSKYNICNHGAQVVMDCPWGLQWSSKVEQCVWPHESDCNNNGSEDNATNEEQDGGADQDGGSQNGGSRCEEGVLSAHADCNKYNKCSHGANVAMDCPAGLHWNAALQECVWPHESNCDISGSATDAPSDGGSQNGGCVQGALSANEDCSKYNICNHGAQVVMDCPWGLQWSSKVEQCVWPHESDCNNNGSEDNATNEEQDGGADQDGGSQNGGSRCEEGVLSAHADCNKYNKCSHGANVAMDCPAGLHWNAALQECVWPHESNCDISGSATDAPSDGGSQNGGCVQGALSANEDCSKYNICNHGAQVVMDCPWGLQWSSKVEQCVWPHESDCNNNGSEDNATNEEQDGGADQDGGSQNGGSRCEEGVLSAHADCNKYNKCSHGANVAMDCPAGLHWNAALQYCDWPLAAGCA